MPFLAPLIPAIAAGAGSALAGGAVNAISKAVSGSKDPQAAAIERAVGTGDTRSAIQQSQQALDQQQALANQLAAQGGIQNQSSVFNQLQNVASGQGPNPAQAMLAQATGQNVANQAALMAGQRGAGANVGLLARQAAQQGGALQQNAANQAAVLQANQSLNALNQLGGIAGQQVAQQQQAVGSLMQGAQGQQGQLLKALQGQNQLAIGQQANLNEIQAQNQRQQNQFQQQNMQGLSSGLGSALASGMTKTLKLADGGMIDAIGKENYKGSSKIGRLLMAQGGSIDMKRGGHVPGTPKVAGAKDSYSNDTVPAMLSPGEIVLPRSVTMSANPEEAAARFVAAIKAKKGKK